MKTYPSKISYGLFGFILLMILGSTVLMIVEKAWLPIIINVVVIVFISHMLYTTYYTVEGSVLHIKSGFLYKADIDISSIKKITETNNPLSSPAASMDRLEIQYKKYDRVMISPKEKEAFIQHLLQINPQIEVKLKAGKTLPSHS